MSGWSIVKQGQPSNWDVVKQGNTLSTPMDALVGMGSGIVHGTPKLMDTLAGAIGEVLNQASPLVGGTPVPIGDVWNASTNFNDAVNKVAPEYKPKTIPGKLGELVGEAMSPNLAAKIPTAISDFVKGTGGSLSNYVKDPQKLVDAYKAWESGLESQGFAKGYLQQNLVDPLMEKLKFQVPTMDKAGRETLDAIQSAAPKLPNARYVEGLRKNLSGDGSPVATVARETIDEMYGKAGIDQAGRDAYRRFRTLGDVQDALRNAGNEGVKATRTKINNIPTSGMTDAEIAAKQAAGTPGLLESALRTAGRSGNSLLSAMTGVATQSPAAGFGLYSTGRVLEKAADAIGRSKVNALQEVLLNGRAAPSTAEELGALLRNVLKGK